MLWKLIVVNVAVFLTVRVLGIVASIGGWDINSVVDQLAMPSYLPMLAERPWTAVTYMFTHYDVFHILFNMLALYWFGQLMLYRCTPRQLTALYVYGGVAGAALYLLAAQAFPAVSGFLLGASASVMAIMVAIAILMPDFEIGLMFIGRVKLKWVAVGAVVIFALGLVGNNAGGHVAHIGGMAVGAVFGLMLNRGVDITAPFNRLIDKAVNLFGRVKAPSGGAAFGSSRGKSAKNKFGKKRPRRHAAASAQSQADDRRDLDLILDKIKRSGYSSLTADEKKRLFEVSSRIK